MESWERHPPSNPEHPRGFDVDDGSLLIERVRHLCPTSAPAPLSHIGSGTCVSLFGPAPAPGRHWLRHLCPTGSTTYHPILIFTCAHTSQGGSRSAYGALGG